MTISELRTKINNFVETVKVKTNISGYRLNIIFNDLLDKIDSIPSGMSGFSNPLYSTSSDAAIKILDFNIVDSSDYVLNGGDVTTWINKGINGIDANEAVNMPALNLPEFAMDFVSANSDSLTLDNPVEMDNDTGWSLMIGFKQTSDDRYLIGSSNSDGFRIFLRNANISILESATKSRTYDYAGWGETKKTGRAILELTSLSGSINIEARLNNGSSYIGNAGTLSLDKTFFDTIGAHLAASFLNGQVSFVYFQNKPFTTSKRTAKYAEKSAIYVPE